MVYMGRCKANRLCAFNFINATQTFIGFLTVDIYISDVGFGYTGQQLLWVISSINPVEHICGVSSITTDNNFTLPPSFEGVVVAL